MFRVKWDNPFDKPLWILRRKGRLYLVLLLPYCILVFNMFKRHLKPLRSPRSGLNLKGHCYTRTTGYCIDILQTSILFISCPVACPYHLRQAWWIIFTSLAWQENAKHAEVQRPWGESIPLDPQFAHHAGWGLLCVCGKGSCSRWFFVPKEASSS